MSDTPITPTCIGVILDGNRRWARAQGLPTLEGHRRGFEKTKEMLSWAHDAGIAHVVLYAFSTENWNRSEEELRYLMDLYEEFAEAWGEEIKKKNGRIRFIGQRSRFRPSLQEKMERVEKETENATGQTLWVALSYGGRAEILDAVQTLLSQGASSVTQETFEEALWSAGMPEPDLIIRTGGEQRLSNFLTWQSVYSELFFLPSYLPALTKEEFEGVLTEYAARERRRGR